MRLKHGRYDERHNQGPHWSGVRCLAFLYYTGRLRYDKEKERVRQQRVKKYGWLLIIGMIVCTLMDSV